MEVSVLVDRAVGGSSLVDGQIELMLHRLAVIISMSFFQFFAVSENWVCL